MVPFEGPDSRLIGFNDLAKVGARKIAQREEGGQGEKTTVRDKKGDQGIRIKNGDTLLSSCLMSMDRGRWLYATHSASLGSPTGNVIPELSGFS